MWGRQRREIAADTTQSKPQSGRRKRKPWCRTDTMKISAHATRATLRLSPDFVPALASVQNSLLYKGLNTFGVLTNS
ncbi:hypothetical protein RSOLAG1IB_12267 [Rhizoctonia solani AG-1 IB]|uniref:Uncharacterized protein n=1 Tax=Thanatephorus cucumeris (strain AG1-IB / isolate 7/3/14) TaxID=1108050 RepID=A0A0B7FNE6_THACB|nr:hypothetical protein RSOLAG1IB_12267 [Rhizoctonia solani AG-1 IB]